jgi:hypothetical protein
VNNRHLDSSDSFLICPSLYLGVPGFLGCCFSRNGVLESEWGLFTPPLPQLLP